MRSPRWGELHYTLQSLSEEEFDAAFGARDRDDPVVGVPFYITPSGRTWPRPRAGCTLARAENGQTIVLVRDAA